MRSFAESIRDILRRLFQSATNRGPLIANQPAARQLEQIVSSCSPLELAQLDWIVRDETRWDTPSIEPGEVARISEGRATILGVLASNSSGHVREAAVRALAQIQDGRELAFLLIRLNDWVPQVRDMARTAVLQRIRPDCAPIFVRCLPLIYRLQDQRRENHRQVLAAVLGLLKSREARPALQSGLASHDRHTRRFAFRLLTEAPGQDLVSILTEAIFSNDAVIRLWAARRVREMLDGTLLRDLLGRLWRDRSMPVRREALYGFVEKAPESASHRLNAALMDPHISMREAARFYLRQAGQQDFASFYRDQLPKAEGEALATAIAGLGETGTGTDAERLVPFLDARTARVRRAAVGAIGRLDPEGHIESLLRKLDDELRSVAKAARDASFPHRHILSPQRLSSALQTAAHAHAREMIFTLILARNWWDSAPLLVMATMSDDQQIRDRAVNKLHAWAYSANRLMLRPSREQLRLLQEVFHQHGHTLDPSIRADLSSVLAYAARE